MNKRRRADRGPVTASCLSCDWSTSGSTWRPVKRRLAEHTGKRHKEIAA